MNSKLICYFIIFTVSGFSGLIYESIWSRYLKMFLGHASYAQVMALIIFMGGMAIGSAIAAKYSPKIKNLILAYAAAEIIIGIFGITFHSLFTNVMDFTFSALIPGLENASSINIMKFTIAGAMILPQSILLGATFPLITAGLIRLYPNSSGDTIARLYFFNSIGAAAGVLANAFILVPAVGLPGAVLSAGLINVVLAILVYSFAKNDTITHSVAQAAAQDISQTKHKEVNLSYFTQPTSLFFLIALITGVASFMYEIAWIRMLSMVLGASTDAFEIMLSAFILGLAIGSWLIRKRIAKIKNVVLTLAVIQILMATFAAATIPFYNYTFDLMADIYNVLRPNESGYVLYNTASFLICILVMLPTAICAGTTLPLLTHILLAKDKNESSIGWVYCFNTIGAILGIIIAVQLIMPNFGLKALVLTGAVLDLTLGAILIFTLAKFGNRTQLLVPATACVLLLLIGSKSSLSLERMSGGVFRLGVVSTENVNVLYSEHGKTSSVAIQEVPEGLKAISNNGKPDAALYSDYEREFGGDEPTMVLLGTIPFIHNAENKTVANIGFGSGLTSEMILTNPDVKLLDTIEIEPKIIEASKFFAPKVARVHADPRSTIIIDDAKTFFTSSGKKYDVIIAEPSNPWVSGVSSLFSREFYNLIKGHLNTKGVYAQWIQAYEITPELISSIYLAMRTEFPYISLYSVGPSDMVFVLSLEPSKPNFNYFNDKPESLEMLDYVASSYRDDLRTKHVADQRLLDHFFNNYTTTFNSDYFPILDSGAPKARFMRSNANIVLELGKSKFAKQVFDLDYAYQDDGLVIHDELGTSFGSGSKKYLLLKKLIEVIRNDFEKSSETTYPQEVLQTVYRLQSDLEACSNLDHILHSQNNEQNLLSFVKQELAYLSNQDALYLLTLIETTCTNTPKSNERFELQSIKAFLNKNYQQVISYSNNYFDTLKVNQTPSLTLVKIYIASLLYEGEVKKAERHLDKINSLAGRNDAEFMLLTKILQKAYL